ncbi:HAD family hydrolase [Agrobacterium larrymoorei]|uniref:Beta-phosphoglucomutase-like phosphatase (HAD superfamily) n=1 Tax=Agrobacterium larrymoorei TaxID=160699 RepID=A0ABU0UJY4_9HYPH|nr:HAD family phosphatase [Agrobacterium larrymoorei]MDQ1185266.1 beta-phosphoglucomutase-like phosphatase (HAD superfamily) [Agrobacterium larrymoorei]
MDMTLPHMPKAVIFDMDGLLIDSETLYRDSFLAASQEGGHNLPVELYQRVCGSPWDVISGTIIAENGADFPMDAFRDAWLRHLAISMAGGVQIKTGVVEMLDLLDDLKLPRAIATSSRHESVDRHLGPHNLLGRFDHIVAREDYTEPKPSPMPYLICRQPSLRRSRTMHGAGGFLSWRSIRFLCGDDDGDGAGCSACDRANAGEMRCDLP